MTNQIDLSKVKKVRQTNHSAMANALIDAGWTLLGVSPGHDKSNGPEVVYAFGWIKDSDPIDPKFP